MKYRRLHINYVSSEEFLPSNSFLQTVSWGMHKEAFDWKAYYFIICMNGVEHKKVPLLLLVRSVGFGRLLAYAPQCFSETTLELLQWTRGYRAFIHEVSVILRVFFTHRLIGIRYEPLWYAHVVSHVYHVCIWRGLSIQPPDTFVLSLHESPEILLAHMHKKTRYNIRLGMRQGVYVIRDYSPDLLYTWYRLYEDTAKRDNIAIHSYEYYESFMRHAHIPQSGMCVTLFMAYHENDVLGGIIVVLHNKKATYLYGASSNIKRQLMGSYVLQWNAILWAQQCGADSYDFFGIPPSKDSVHHSMARLYQFKSGFGGTHIRYVGALDYIIQPLWYIGYVCAERIRYYIKNKKHKKK